VKFNLCALLFFIINDFPSFGILRDYIVKEYHACSICEKNIVYHELKHRRKASYIGYHRFSKCNHPYRRWKLIFNRCEEDKIAPPPLISECVYNLVCQIEVIFGKTQKKNIFKNIWKKKSIFFELPYWSKLNVRNCINVMYIEKNVYDNIIDTLLNIKGKTKDEMHVKIWLRWVFISNYNHNLMLKEHICPQHVILRKWSCHYLVSIRDEFSSFIFWYHGSI